MANARGSAPLRHSDIFDFYVFDLDGTIIDSRRDLAGSATFARTELELAPLPLETIPGFIGDGVRRLLERSLGEEVAARQIEEAMTRFQSHYLEHATDWTRPYPGVVETLARSPGRLALYTTTCKEVPKSCKVREHSGR